MEEHERGYIEGYKNALGTVKAMIDGGMRLAEIKAAVEEELEAEEQEAD